MELKNGLLNLQYDFGFKDGPVTLDSTSPKLQINDARYHEVNSPTAALVVLQLLRFKINKRKCNSEFFWEFSLSSLRGWLRGSSYVKPSVRLLVKRAIQKNLIESLI